MGKINQRQVSQAKFVALAITLVTAFGCNSQKYELPPAAQDFGQKVTYANDVDVLFVVDTRGSMAKHQSALAAQIGTMIDAFNQTGLNYQIAVTTMDMSADGEKGKFIGKPGTPRILNSSTPNLAGVLAERLAIGVYDWQPMARALEATKAALSDTNSSSSPNSGFLRPNALLTLIYLSDSDDHSDSTVNYKQFLDQLRPPLKYGDRSWVAQYIGIVPTDPNCTTNPAFKYNEVGSRYIDLANASGGATESLCDGDMRRALTNVKARVLELVTEYPLNTKPVVSSIKVTVNGRSVPNDETNGWTYVATGNFVRFHGTAIPGAGSSIKVDFDRDGLN